MTCCLQISLRYTLDSLIAGEDAPFQWRRHLAETTGIIVSTLLVALIFPAYAEKIFAITGATAVCIVCYVIPVGLHLKLRSHEQARTPGLALIQQEEREVQALLLPAGEHEVDEVHVSVAATPQDAQQQYSISSQYWQTTHQVVLPIIVVVVGVCLSVAALFTTCRQWFVAY